MTAEFSIRPPLTVVGDEGVKVPAEVLRAAALPEFKWVMIAEDTWAEVPMERQRAGEGWTETPATRCPVCQRWTPCPVHPETANG